MSADSPLSTIEDVLEDARRGKMIILVDAEDRENEGDLLVPAAHATPDVVNFMARYGRGLICLALTGERVDQLRLSMMSRENVSRHNTAFTESIEAREGIATGISAADRARTIAVAIDETKGRQDIATPGHVFPIRARDGGVLVRAGHTEAAVDIARLAGFAPAGVICEIMNDDGTMARLPDLVAFAQRHGLRIGTIADLIRYRLRYDTLVERVVDSELSSLYGGRFRIIVYRSRIDGSEHIALVQGNDFASAPVPVRVHAFNTLDDVLCDRGGRGGFLHAAMHRIGEQKRGVVVIIRENSARAVSARVLERAGRSVPDPPEHRDIGLGAQILRDLGVREMIVLSTSRRPYVGLEGYGLHIAGHEELALLAVSDDV